MDERRIQVDEINRYFGVRVTVTGDGGTGHVTVVGSANPDLSPSTPWQRVRAWMRRLLRRG